MAPRVILHLGGNTARVYKTLSLALTFPQATIVVSSEADPVFMIDQFRQAGVLDRVVFNFKAWDTLTNFTDTLRIVRDLGATQVFVVTEPFHMRRAMMLARVIYWLEGIKPIAAPTSTLSSHRDPIIRLVKDFFRVWVWKWTTYVIAEPDLKHARKQTIQTYAHEAARELLRIRNIPPAGS